MAAIFYVYCLFRPWNGEPCYIGKGKGRRAQYHWNNRDRHENAHLGAILKRAARLGLEVPCIILQDSLEESIAYEYEIAFIKALGRDSDGGPLVNKTDGGEGGKGLVWTDAMRTAQAELHGPRFRDPSYIARMSELNRGNQYNLGRKPTPEQSARHSAQLLGNTHRRGKKSSPETVQKHVDRFKDPSARQNNSVKIKALWNNPDYRAQQMASRQASEAYQTRAQRRKSS